jgi:hypothetical protein
VPRPHFLRAFLGSAFVREAAVATLAALVVGAAYLLLQVRAPHEDDVATEPPAVLSKRVPDVTLADSLGTAILALNRAASVRVRVDTEAIHQGQYAGAGLMGLMVPPVQSPDLRLRNVTLDQALHALLWQVAGDRLQHFVEPDGTIVVTDPAYARRPPQVVRMYDVRPLQGEAAAFSLAFARQAFGPAAPGRASDDLLDWSAEQFQVAFERAMGNGQWAHVRHEGVGGYFFVRQTPLRHRRLRALIATMARPQGEGP